MEGTYRWLGRICLEGGRGIDSLAGCLIFGRFSSAFDMDTSNFELET